MRGRWEPPPGVTEEPGLPIPVQTLSGNLPVGGLPTAGLLAIGLLAGCGSRGDANVTEPPEGSAGQEVSSNEPPGEGESPSEPPEGETPRSLIHRLPFPCGGPWEEEFVPADQSLAQCHRGTPLPGEASGDPAACRTCGTALAYMDRLERAGLSQNDQRILYYIRFAPETRESLELVGTPFRGPADAPVSVVLFSDFQCPYCAVAHRGLVELLQSRPDQVRVAFKHFPLTSIHEQALPAACLATAGEEKGRFWEVHDALFDAQGQLGPELYQQLSKRWGLALEGDSEGGSSGPCTPARMQRVELDRNEAQRLGLRGTPSIFVNGRRYYERLEDLGDYVDEATLSADAWVQPAIDPARSEPARLDPAGSDPAGSGPAGMSDTTVE